jgi:hypothetical protein
MLKQIVGRSEMKQGSMKRIQTFRNLIWVDMSSLQVSFDSDVIFWLWRNPRNVSLDTHDTPAKVPEVLYGTIAQRSEMNEGDFEI